MTDEILAKNLIDGGASLNEFARCFPTSLDAYGYYAETMHNRFSFDQATQASQCACCGSASEGQVCEIIWRAVVHDKVSGGFALVVLDLRRAPAPAVHRPVSV